jgi:hypothetical protein
MMLTFKRLAFLAGAIAIVTTSPGCQRTPRAAAAERVHPTYDQATGRLKRLEYDSNGDGKIDTWGYMDGMRVVRVEVDEDGDGKVDRWEYHSTSGDGGAPANGGVDKTIERIERATRHDGKVSRWEFFKNGSLQRVEEDTDGDGRVDKWEAYSGGTLSVMALDTDRIGKPTRRLIYRPDGSLDHIEVDPTGSGTFRPLAQ